MAFIMEVELDNGLIVPNSYVRVNAVGGGKHGCVIELQYYANRSAFLNGKKPIQVDSSKNFVPSTDDNAPNFIKQAYLYLKTLPEFNDATDVLEEGQAA